MADGWEDAPGQWEDAPSTRKTPKQMKIGREGFGEAFGQVLEEATPFARNAAAFGASTRALYEGAKQRLGIGDPEAIRATRMLEEREPGAALAGGVASMIPLSMVPGAGTIAGQTALGAGMGALTPTEGKESVGKNIALSALTSGGVGVAMKGLGMAAKPFLARAEQSAAAKASQESVRDETIRMAHAAGLRLPSTATGGGEIAEAVESVGMRGATARDFSILNQPRINAVAREEASLPPNAPINEENLAKARDILAQPYKEISAVSPRAQEALEKLKEVRRDAQDWWKKYGIDGDPTYRKAATAADNKAELYEKVIDNEAKRVGRPDLLPALRQARIAIAKNHNVESAVNLGTGDIDSKVLGRLLDRKGLNAVTGGLQMIGRVAQAFPSYVNAGARGTSRAAGYGIARPLAAGALGLGGYEVGEKYGFGPWGASAAGLALLSGPARRIALSRMLQSTPTYSPGMAAQLTHAATGPLAQRLIPLSSVAGIQTQP